MLTVLGRWDWLKWLEESTTCGLQRSGDMKRNTVWEFLENCSDTYIHSIDDVHCNYHLWLVLLDVFKLTISRTCSSLFVFEWEMSSYKASIYNSYFNKSISSYHHRHKVLGSDGVFDNLYLEEAMDWLIARTFRNIDQLVNSEFNSQQILELLDDQLAMTC